MEQHGGRGYSLKSRLREPTHRLSLLPRLHRAVRDCSLRYSGALFAYIGVSTERCGSMRLSFLIILAFPPPTVGQGPEINTLSLPIF